MSSSKPRFGDALGHGPSDKRIDILRGIGRSGSISQAARDAAVSYKAAWQAIATLGNLAGVALVERAVGGAGGGGATLTAAGRELLARAEAHGAARRALQALPATGGGSVSGAGDVGGAVGLADAVARLALRTSMRNQLPATVESIERSGRVARVVLALPKSGAGSLAARVTAESVELLGLVQGSVAIVLCKATAVRVARPDADGPLASGNRLQGRVAQVTRGDVSGGGDGGDAGDEIVVALDGGLQLVGFAPAGSRLRTRQRIVVSVDEAAVVIAVPG